MPGVTAGGEGGAQGARGEAAGGAGGDTRGRGAAPAAASPPRCANPRHPDVRARPIQMRAPAACRCSAAPVQMCAASPPTAGSRLPRPDVHTCPGPPAVPAPPDVPLPGGGEAAGAPRAHPGLIPGSSRAGCQPQPFKGRDCGFLSAPGRNAPVRGPRCYSWLCQGLIGRGRASSLLPCPLPWAAGSPRDAAGSSLAPGMGESKDKAPF